MFLLIEGLSFSTVAAWSKYDGSPVVSGALHVTLGFIQHNNVFQQKPAFNVSVQGSLPIVHHRLALTGTLLAPPGSAEDVRYAPFEFLGQMLLKC